MTLRVESWFLCVSLFLILMECWKGRVTQYFHLKQENVLEILTWRANIVLGFFRDAILSFFNPPPNLVELIKGKDHILTALYVQCPTCCQAYNWYLINTCERKEGIVFKIVSIMQ